MSIASDPGFGTNPNGWWSDPYEFQKCHHIFSRYPVPGTTVLRRYDKEKKTIFIYILHHTIE